MCLENVTYKRAKIATEDIPCYKILDKISKGFYLTPYQRQGIVLGRTYTSALDSPGKWDSVEQGLHAFLTLQQAVELCMDRRNRAIVKCIIPKGARYYIGTYQPSHGKTAIAASELRYNNKTLKKCVQ